MEDGENLGWYKLICTLLKVLKIDEESFWLHFKGGKQLYQVNMAKLVELLLAILISHSSH